MSSTPTSESSTKVGSDSSMLLEEPKSLRRRTFERAQRATTAQDILLFLVAFRILNALSSRTFFQPDEFFQSLEPAWQIAFGKDSGAWITWEWKNQLRSAIHPGIFAGVYWLISWLSMSLRLSAGLHADLIVAAPKVTQAVIAAMGDFYTWQLASRIYGHGSSEAWAALILTVCSPWQWFCSTRTLSNCLETTLTIIALNYWPWHWVLDKTGDEQEDKYGLRKDAEGNGGDEELARRLCRCLLLAALACILRPTNILIWICFACVMLWRTTSFGWLVPFRRPEAPLWIHISGWTNGPATSKERLILVLEAVLCGALVLLFSTFVDRLYYEHWTFPPFRFLYFNVAQSLSVFYGNNPWHYYLTQGYPLLLTTFLPFGSIGLLQSLSSDSPISASPLTSKIAHQLGATCLIVPSILSLISHKEVRFIYPLLPLLHILAAHPFTSFFLPCISPTSPREYASLLPRRLLLTILALSTIALSLLTTTAHQTAPLSVMTYLRTQYTTHYLSQPPSTSALTPAPSIMTVGFLMPCHSTPWRSHLVFPGIKAWALGCEPPIGLNTTARASYLDEADRFYADPIYFLNHELGKPPQAKRSSFFGLVKGAGDSSPSDQTQSGPLEPWDGQLGKKMWPEYVAFFGQLEPVMKKVLKGTGYRECWRGWNSWGHDDWRRKGDMVVYCSRDRDKKIGSKRQHETLKVGWW